MTLPDDLDHDKLARAALALLALTRDGDGRAWKSLDWDLMDRLHDNGWILDPKNKAKSVVLTELGEELAERYLYELFGEGTDSPPPERSDGGTKGKQPTGKPVSLKECLDNLDMLGDEDGIYVHRSTGKVHVVDEYVREVASAAAEEEPGSLGTQERELLELVQGVDETDDYLLLPDKFDIHEWDIMRRFCGNVEDDDQCQELNAAIHGRGAFRMFRSAIRRMGLEDDWYEFKDEALARIVIDWFEAEGIVFVDDRRKR